jgi:hypothetical protein
MNFLRAIASPNPAKTVLRWRTGVESFRIENRMNPASLTALLFPRCRKSSV